MMLTYVVISFIVTFEYLLDILVSGVNFLLGNDGKESERAIHVKCIIIEYYNHVIISSHAIEVHFIYVLKLPDQFASPSRSQYNVV